MSTSIDTQAVLQAAEQDRAEAENRWTQRRAMLAWAAQHNLKRSDQRSGLRWLYRKRPTSPFESLPALLPRPTFAWDHTTSWIQTGTGAKLIVTQPYDIKPPAEEQVVTSEDLTYRICWHDPSWYSPSTMLIIVLVPDEVQRFPYDGSLAEPDQVYDLWRTHYGGNASNAPIVPFDLETYVSRELRNRYNLAMNTSFTEAKRLLAERAA